MDSVQYEDKANFYERQQLVAEYKQLVDGYREKTILVKVCPVCSHKHFMTFHRNIIRLKNLSTYFISDDYLIYCLRCGLIMVDRVYPLDYYYQYINRFYDVQPSNEFASAFSRLKAKQRCEILKRSGVCINDALEVSSFDGVTLDMLQKQFRANVTGVEPTKSAVEFAVKRFPNLLNRVHNDCFERYAGYGLDNKYDTVLFSYCFRAISNPRSTMNFLQKIVKPGGVVIVDEGFLIEDCLMFHESGEIRKRIYAQKLFYFGLHSLIYLFESFGFTYNYFIRSDCRLNYMAAVFTNTGIKKINEDRLILSRLASENAMRVSQQLNYSDKDVISSLLKH